MSKFKKGDKSWLKGTKGLITANAGSFKKGLTPHNKGKKTPENVVEKLRISHRGKAGFWKDKKLPQYVKDKLRQSHLGKGHKQTQETKQKISNAHFKGGLTWLQKKEKIAGRNKPEQCEICGSMGTICFDHDHATGKFRGWICKRCNFTLGFVKDSVELLDNLSKYLLKNK